MAKRTKRFMENIREKGGLCLGIFLGIFLISVFAGLGISGGFSFKGCSMQQQQQQAVAPRMRLDTSAEMARAVLTVNGEPVDEQLYYETLDHMRDYIRSNNRADPAALLVAYGYTASQLVMQETIRQRGVELGVQVANEDIKEAKSSAIAPYLATEAGSTGNILGDLVQKMGSNREVKAAFEKFLGNQGLSEQQWLSETKRNLIVQKTREELQVLLDAEKALQVAEDKAIIDQRLADGESFAVLAKEFSDSPGENQDEPLWIGRELALPQQTEAMFGTPVGEITDWIEVPAGWYRFEVTGKKLAEGEDFEAKRDEIIQQLISDGYEPTDEQIAGRYEQVEVIQIQLRIDDPGAANRELDELMQQAHVEVNDPYILAYQALMLEHIQPPQSMGFDQLVSIAKTAQTGEDYDFQLIQHKLDKGVEIRAGEPEDEVVSGDNVDEIPDEAAIETDVSSESDVEPVSEDDEEQFYSLYPLAIGLFKMAIQENENAVGHFPYYMIADTYIKWLDDEDARVKQPLERTAAREEIETNLARAAESNDYSSMLHAQRGLNLAWQERKEEALASLALAIKYAPHDQQNPVWEIVREGYEVADAQDELAALDDKLAEYRRAAFQAQIEQAQRDAKEKQESQVISIPGDAADEDSEASTDKDSSEDTIADENGDEVAEGEE